MSKSKNQNKKFLVSVSLDQVRSDRSSFVVDLRKKKEELPKKNNLKHQSGNGNYSWKTARIASSWPFLLKPLTHHKHRGVLLDHRAEELRDRLAMFEKKVFRHTFLGRAISFVFALLVIFIPFKLLAYYKLFSIQDFKAQIISSSHLAVNDLMSAASAASRLDLKIASNNFSSAGRHFLEAENSLKNIDHSLLQLAALSGSPEMKLAAVGKKFLSAGVLASSLGKHLSLAMDGFFSQGNPADSLKQFIAEGGLALVESKKLVTVLNSIDPKVLPEGYQQQFVGLQKKVAILNNVLTEALPAANYFGELLGINRSKRYLIIFQNNTEMRGGGGFMGSYALVDFNNGQIKNLEIPGGGTYDTEGGLNSFVKSPEALRLIAPRWYFWDANWFPDWALSAENIRWFYEKSGGPTVDGVIALTPDIIPGLLEITGPIDLTDSYGVVVNSNNFYEVTQQIAEKDNLIKAGDLSKDAFQASSSDAFPLINNLVPVKQNLGQGQKPKKIIGDLTARILTELPKKLDRNNFAKLLALIEKSLDQKQLMFNFNDPAIQAEMERRNWAGRQPETSGDYLMVASSNISGGKSDYKISEKIQQSTEILSDGRVVNTVRITRKHNGILREKLFGSRNVDWLRVYVPLGSQLISAIGFKGPDPSLFEDVETEWEERPIISNGEGRALKTSNGTMIYEENNKTVFANWLMVDPGDEVTVELRYYLPFKISIPNKNSDDSLRSELNKIFFGEKTKLTSYSLLVQKQPGAKPSEYSGQLDLSGSALSSIWNYPEQQKVDQSGWRVSLPLERDLYFGAIIKNNN